MTYDQSKKTSEARDEEANTEHKKASKVRINGKALIYLLINIFTLLYYCFIFFNSSRYSYVKNMGPDPRYFAVVILEAIFLITSVNIFINFLFLIKQLIQTKNKKYLSRCIGSLFLLFIIFCIYYILVYSTYYFLPDTDILVLR